LATTIPLRGFSTAGHILINCSKELAVLTKALRVKDKENLLGSQCCISSSFPFRIQTDLLAFNFFAGTPKIVKPEKPVDGEVISFAYIPDI
jgi:hypothetical protein